MTGLFLCRPITRDGEEYDVVIYFKIVSYAPGYPATTTDPSCGPEYEFEFLRAEIDGDDDGVPLTEPEIAGLRAWFDANHDLAVECANDAADWGPDPDDERDRRRDDRMMGVR
jgi:hypothetical protein